MMSNNRLSGEEKSFRHYTSTPHLDTFRGGNNNMQGSMYGSNNPYQSTFSTFTHHKSGVDLRYRDDPNPYKVSTIDEFRIKVQDPYKASRPIPPPHSQSHYASYYTGDEAEPELPDTVFRRLSIKYETPQCQYYNHSSNSGSSGEGEYEIPDPDYDGSTAGSSDDLPIPEPLVLSRPPNGDSCEEYSISISASEETASASHSSPSPTTTVTKISDAERAKVEHAFRGRKTSVYVADSLTNLYYMKKTSAPPRPNSTGSNGSGHSQRSTSEGGTTDWVLKYTGVLVLLLDTGETKNRDKRQIQIVLAELGSGLALWKDVVDNLTSYKVTPEASSFHTMHLSSDHTVVVGFSFDDEDTADRFYRRIDKLTSDFANISLSGSKSKNKKEKKVKPVKFIRPKKTEISQPCGFQHIASVTSQDKKLFPALQEFVNSRESRKPSKSGQTVHGDDTRPELHL